MVRRQWKIRIVGTVIIGSMLVASTVDLRIPALFVLVVRPASRRSGEVPGHANVPQLSPSEGDLDDKTDDPLAGRLANFAPECGLRCGTGELS